MKRIFHILWIAAAVASIYPGTSTAQPFVFPSTATPMIDLDPGVAIPLGIGAAATGGPTLSIEVGTTAFAAPMDLYLGLFAPFFSPEIFLFRADNSLTPLSQEAAVWRRAVTAVHETLVGSIPVSDLPRGTYFLLLLVTPANSLASSTLWQTSFTITDPPAAPHADFYPWIGNTPLAVSAAWGVLANDPAGSAVAQADTATALGGTVSVSSNGGFVYTPAAGARGADSFTYTVAGEPATTVTIQLDTGAWYADNTAVANGEGTLTSPFNTLRAAQDSSLDGDTIFVFTGSGMTGQDAGIDLKPGQKLLGRGVDFAFRGITIVPAALPPVIGNTRIGPQFNSVVTLAGNNEVAGFIISGVGATQIVRGIFGLSPARFHVHHNVFDGMPKEGIYLDGPSEAGIIADNSFNNLVSLEPGNAIRYIAASIDPATGLSTRNISLAITNNTFRNVLATCIDMSADTTTGTLTVTGNTMTTEVATAPGAMGIDVKAGSSSILATVISGNTVGSAAGTHISGAGIRFSGNWLGANNVAILNNTVLNAGQPGDGTTPGIWVEASGTSDINGVCLKMAGNISTGNGGPGYLLWNRPPGEFSPTPIFQVEGDRPTLEAINTGTFTYQSRIGIGVEDIIFVPEGTCGL